MSEGCNIWVCFAGLSIQSAGLNIIRPPGPFPVGGAVLLTCESEAAGLIEWLDSDMTVLVSGSGSSLNYTISPVRDSLHQSTLTCRGPGGAVTITISVEGESTV